MLLDIGSLDNLHDHERRARLSLALDRVSHLNRSVLLAHLDVGMSAGVPFVASDTPARTLVEALRDRPSFIQRLQWLEQLCEGIAHVHASGLTHGALALEQIGVTLDGSIRIGGLGVECVFGAPTLAAQERRGCDIHAIGAIAAQLLVGGSDDDLMLGPELIHARDTMLYRASAGANGSAYATVQELADTLAMLRGRVTPARSPYAVAPATADAATIAGPERGIEGARARERRQRMLDELLALGRAALDAGDVDAALEHGERATIIDPDHADALGLVVRARAAVEARRGLEAALTEARTLLYGGAYRQAREVARTAMAIAPDNVDARQLAARADALVRTQDEATARALRAGSSTQSPLAQDLLPLVLDGPPVGAVQQDLMATESPTAARPEVRLGAPTPDERASQLIEAARHWLMAGDVGRGLALLEGDASGHPAVQIAMRRFRSVATAAVEPEDAGGASLLASSPGSPDVTEPQVGDAAEYVNAFFALTPITDAPDSHSTILSEEQTPLVQAVVPPRPRRRTGPVRRRWVPMAWLGSVLLLSVAAAAAYDTWGRARTSKTVASPSKQPRGPDQTLVAALQRPIAEASGQVTAPASAVPGMSALEPELADLPAAATGEVSTVARLDTLREQARDRHAKGDGPGALAALSKVLKLDPADRDALALRQQMVQDATAAMQRAKQTAVKVGAHKVARKTYRRALAHEADVSRARKAGRWDRALRSAWNARDGFAFAATRAKAGGSSKTKAAPNVVRS